MPKFRWMNVLCGALVCLALPVQAEDAPPPEKAELRYVELKPTFITNFGFSERGYLRYIKADVALRVNSKDGEEATYYHLPALRHELVLLLSSQDEATISDLDGREKLEDTALETLRGLLEREEGEPYIEDLMFTNFIVQR